MSITTSRGRTGQQELPAAWPPTWQHEKTIGLPTGAVPSNTASTAAPVRSAGSTGTHGRGLLTPALALWLVIYALLNVGDLASTYFGLQLGLREANPLMSGLLVQNGFGALIAYKLVVIVAVIGGAFALYRMHPRAAYLTVYICNFLVFLAVAANVVQMVLR